MWQIPIHTQLFLQSLSGYAGMFFVRDALTSSSTHLSKLGYFTARQYSIFVSCNYASQSISRIGAGILIDWTNEPKYVYLITCVIAIVSMFCNSFLQPHHQETAVLMGLSYVIIKTMCSFSRNSLMKMLAKYFQHKDFGTVNNLLAGFGAVSNASCMLLMTLFFRNNWKWSHICYLIAGVVFILNIPLGFVKRKSKPTRTQNTRTDEKGHNGFVNNLSASLRKPVFYILLLLSMCISVVRVNTSFISWYLVVMLKVKSEDCPALASILFGLSVLAIFTGAGINQLPSRHHNIVTFITSLLSVASIVTLYYVHRKNSDPSFMLCMVLMGIQSFMSTPINCLVDGFYAYEISTRETQSTVIGCSSGVGYLSAAITAFLIKDEISTKEGWISVFRYQMGAGTLMLTLLSIYILLRPVKYT